MDLHTLHVKIRLLDFSELPLFLKDLLYLENGPVVLQNLLLHLHQLRDGFMESEELWGNLFLLQTEWPCLFLHQ